jgi:uncharacterized repeat protein (TIGR01451 family)
LFWKYQMKPVLLALTLLMLTAFAGGAAANCITDTTQTDFTNGSATNVDMAASPGNVLLSNTGGGGATVDQHNTSITANGERIGKDANGTVNAGHWAAQTFTAGVSGSLSRIDLNLFCVFCSAAPPPMIVSVRATSGGLPTGADLASTTLTITDWSGTQAWYSANFSAPTTVTARTQYAIVIRTSTAYSSGNIAFSDSAVSSTSGNDVYAGGTLDFSLNGGSSWSVETGPYPSVDGGFKTYVGGAAGGYTSAGDLVSSTKDSNPGTSVPNWTTLSWTNAPLPNGTSIRFQAAASANSTGPFNFVGPDGSSGSYFTASGGSLSQFNGARYLKYRAFLATTSGSVTPTLSDATVCFNNASNADLSITNSDGAATAIPGNKVIYTITAANAAGASTVTGATVTDTFQQPLSNCTFTCVGSNGGACPSTGTGNINSSVTLPGGASATFTATCSVAAAATGSLVNTASIAPPAGTNDTNPDNNSATDTDTLTPTADLSITNNDAVGGATPGNTITYVIRAANAGPSEVTGVQVTDDFPAALTCNWTCSGANGGTCAASGSGAIDDATVHLPPKGASVTYSATCKISSAATGTVSNTATVTPPASATDPATGNNTATDSDPLTVRADAAVTMNDGITAAQLGDVINYVIQVTNNGPSDTSVTVNDALPAQLSNGSWVCSATGGASCAKSSGMNNNLNTSATVPVGGKATYIYTATLASDNSVDTFTNTVSIGTPPGVDPNGANAVVKDINTIVVYQSGFEADPQTLAVPVAGSTAAATNVAAADGSGDYVAVQMGIDASLLSHLGSTPVTIASGRSANGKNLFSVQLVRLGSDIAMRTLTRSGDSVFSDVSPWHTADLKQHVLNLDWQSASARGNDGYLNVEAGSSNMMAAGRNVRESVTQLHIALDNNIPWLVPIKP